MRYEFQNHLPLTEKSNKQIFKKKKKKKKKKKERSFLEPLLQCWAAKNKTFDKNHYPIFFEYLWSSTFLQKDKSAELNWF